MITHLVLFRPKRDLGREARQTLVETIGRALREIPSIRGLRIGRRVFVGRPYESTNPDYPYAVLLEFDDVDGVRAYLEHPAHAELAARFFEAGEEAIIYDYDLAEDPSAFVSG